VLLADPRSDLAVLKIDVGGERLPVIAIDDAEDLEVGDLVLAIGNPFGVGQTVTNGIISATARSNVGITDYGFFLQTDAAINPGNSGGPLVNLKGEVVGINVAIFSTTGGYQGVGFAIPGNRAKSILGDLIQGKKVLYGWLGVNVQDLSEGLAKHFGLESREGVIVARVLPGSPGEKGGLKDGDVIRSYDGQPIKDVRELLKQVARTKVGKRVVLGVVRDRRPLHVTVEVAERPAELESGEARGEGTWRGLKISAVTPELAERFRIGEADGVIVTHVEPGSPADEGALRVGDLILELNRQPIHSISDFKRFSRAVKGDALLKTSRGYVVLRAGNE